MAVDRREAYEKAVSTVNESNFVVSEENFKYPDMGDYYINAIDTTYFDKVQEILNDTDEEGKRAQFYYEEPYTKTLGYHPEESVYFLKAKPSVTELDIKAGNVDGDTIYVPIDSLVGDTFGEAVDRIKSAVNSSWSKGLVGEPEMIGIRFLGIDTPETPKYSRELLDLSKETIHTTSYGEAKNYNTGLYHLERVDSRDDHEVVDFIKVGSVWKEFRRTGQKSGDKEYIDILMKPGETDGKRYAAGIKARDLVAEILSRPDVEVYLMLDATSLNQKGESYPTKFGHTVFSSDAIDTIKKWAEDVFGEHNMYRYAGYNIWGQDSYGRFLGTVYVKTNSSPSAWINLSKYVISKVNETEIFPDHTHSPLFRDKFGYASRVFSLHTYNFKDQLLADVYEEVSNRMDDRRKIQEKIFGKTFEELKDWTVTIGDTTFFVPPTSIRTITQTTNERMPVVRAKGSITKGGIKSERILELTLYFNDIRGINGYEYETKLPNGEDITYYMNGLRALIAQFKFTPFLPIENNFINKVLGIEAVSLMNLQVSTLPDYPKCIAAVLTLQEFDYRQYMPELPLSFDEDENYFNPFSGTINFEVMRWYYQRALIKGEEIKDIDFNSLEYIEKTFGNKTALVPMKFMTPNIKFYLANEEHLMKMLQVKLAHITRPDRRAILSDVEKDFAKEVSEIYSVLSDFLGSDRYQAELKDLNQTRVGETIRIKRPFFGGNRDIVADGKYGINQLKGSGLYIVDENGNTTVTEEEMDERINNFLSSVRKEVLKVNERIGKTIIEDVDLVYKEDLDYSTYHSRNDSIVPGRVTLGVKLKIRADYITSPDLISDLRREASLETQLQMDDVFKDGTITIPFSATAERNIAETQFSIPYPEYLFKLDANHPDVQFLSYCKGLAVALGHNNNETINEEVVSRKQAIDLELLDTMQYDEYMLGNIRIKNISCAFGNTLTRIGTQGADGYAPQYMGGQDTIVEISIETTDAASVTLLQALPRISTSLTRDYRLVIPASPLKLESEITKLLGVNEVVIENVDVQTVPGQPGLYEVTMRLVTIDRTLRNREALKKVNEFAVSGYRGDDQIEEFTILEYSQLNEALSRAEVYPDLELPTIGELEEKGFEFIRYKLERPKDSYPDPDFYFVYGHVLVSEIFREAIINGIEETLGQYTLTDQDGGKVKTEIAEGYGVVAVDANDVAKKSKETEKALREVAQKEAAEEENELLKSKYDVINTLRASQLTESWDISEDIRTMFMENAYLLLYEQHEQAQKVPGAEESSQGKWVYDAMQKARNASVAIEQYLNNPIAGSDSLNAMNSLRNNPHGIIGNTQSKIEDKVDKLLSEARIKAIFENLDIKVDGKFRKAVKNIIFACACAATSEREYDGKKNKDYWKPNPKFVGMILQNDQDNSGVFETDNVEEAAENAIEFGPFRIKMYSADELTKAIGTPNYTPGYNPTGSSINETYYLLDPYYRRAKTTPEEIKTYKQKCITDIGFATEAFFRIMLFYLKKLIDDKILPNMSLDVLNSEFKAELSASVAYEWSNDEERDEIYEYLKFVENAARSLDGGKIFAASVLALTSGSEIFYEPMKSRDYEKLNGMVQSAMSMAGRYDPKDLNYIFFRKMLLALVGSGQIKKVENIGEKANNPVVDFKKVLNEKKYIQAAEDPTTYIKHSFYDMVVNDMRGRMVRAFPTFYVLFIDSGREIGLWKLHDNFYNINSIAEINVSKSRKIPADTCTITMSNLFHTYTTDDEDLNMNFQYDFRDVFNSVFNPRAYFIKEEAKRLKQQPLNRVKLTAGTRIHVRMGYSANASALPIVFNGVIAEVSAGEAVQIVAQGDGIELTHPILEKTDADDVKNKDSFPIFRFFSNISDSGATPKEILDALLTFRGGWIKSQVRQWTNGYYFRDHPLGITHFGSPEFTTVFKNGEPTQNIFEAINKPKWGDLGSAISEDYSTEHAPEISIELFGKTFWDVLNICTSVSPDFICGIAPFGMRSTIFHGHPRYYYAYDYYTEGGILFEKRKPYQQYHIYHSYTDIICNNIKASSKDIRTNAIGLFKQKMGWGMESQGRVGPMWVDQNIYPEFQKSMVVDTQLYDKGVPIAGSIIPFYNKLPDWFADEHGSHRSPTKIAWRMTAHALKQTMMDMYTGELIVMGDPTVKPHDRIYLADTYENMSGSALVEGVVLTFSAENGFTTTIYPDLIAAVDDRHELAVQQLASNVTAIGLAMASTAIFVSSRLSGKATPILNTIGKSAHALGKGAAKIAKLGNQRGAAAAILKNVRHIKGALSGGRMAAVLGGAASGGTLLIPALLLALEIAIFQLGTRWAYGAIERWMKSKQVLQVFPLKKNGKVLISGMNGTKGVVYGSPSYDQSGFYDKLFKSLDTETNGFGFIRNFLIEMLASDEMKKVARSYRRADDYIEEGDNAPTQEKAFNAILEGISDSQASKIATYKRYLLTPKIDPTSEEDIIRAFNDYAFLDTNGIEIQSQITQDLVYVKNDEKIREAIEQGIFKTKYDNLESGYEAKEFSINGSPVLINTSPEVTESGDNIYDIPFLRPEALAVLREIITKVSYIYLDQEPEDESKAKENHITLQSALRVGDTASLGSTGYSFSLEAVGPTKDFALKNALQSIEIDIEEIRNITGQPTLRLHEVRFISNSQVEITVLPPTHSQRG